MSAINEATEAPPQMAAVLDAGVATLSAGQSITFRQYARVTLSQDGMVFWVANGQKADFSGSLHYITDRHQNEDETMAANRFIFTAQEEITAFNTVSPTTMWIGAWTADGTTLQIAFADRGSFYQQADQWHYGGYAVYPAMRSQLVDSAADLPSGLIISNSLPIWLAQNSFAPVYPAFLVPDNVEPPYVAVHIGEGDTEALGAFPLIGAPGTAEPNTGASPLYPFPVSQLMRDRVKLTFYGFTNALFYQFYMALIDVSLTDAFGFCDSPAVQDAKRTQAEISALAMKKTMLFHASYYQGTADALARRYILSAGFTLNS